jgi:hypothetical protein
MKRRKQRRFQWLRPAVWPEGSNSRMTSQMEMTISSGTTCSCCHRTHATDRVTSSGHRIGCQLLQGASWISPSEKSLQAYAQDAQLILAKQTL